MNDAVRNNITDMCEFQWICLKKDHPFILFYKNTLNENIDFESVDLKVIKPGRPNLKPLLITTMKYGNLQQLLQF